MLNNIGNLPSLLMATFAEWRKDRPPLLAAGLAYYAFFALIPLLLIAAAIGSVFYGQAAVDGRLETALSSIFGEKIAAVIQSAIAQTYSQESSIIVAVAAGVLILGGSYIFVQMRNALNIIWKVQERKSFWKSFVEVRLTSLVMIVGITFVILLWIGAGTMLSAVAASLGASADYSFFMEAGNFIILFLVSGMLFAMIYKLLPSVRLKWEDVWLGSLVTAFLFIIGEYFLGFYISRINIESLYGVAGSMVALLVWLYLSAHIFVFGAVFTKVYASRHGSHRKASRKR